MIGHLVIVKTNKSTVKKARHYNKVSRLQFHFHAMTDAPDKLTETRAPFVPVSNAIAIQMNSFGGTHHLATARRKIRQERRCEGAPSTPLLHWTFYNGNNEKKKPHRSSSCAKAAEDGVKFSGDRYVELSARKLAAGLWQLRRGNGGFGSKRRSSNRLRFGVHMSFFFSMFLYDQFPVL